MFFDRGDFRDRVVECEDALVSQFVGRTEDRDCGRCAVEGVHLVRSGTPAAEVSLHCGFGGLPPSIQRQVKHELIISSSLVVPHLDVFAACGCIRKERACFDAIPDTEVNQRSVKRKTVICINDAVLAVIYIWLVNH